MSEGPPSPDRAVPAFLDYIALACIFGFVDSLLLGRWKVGLLALAAGAIVHVTGIKWEQIELTAGPHISSALERTVRNRTFRWISGATIVTILTALTAFTVYHHLHTHISTVATTTKSTPPVVKPQAPRIASTTEQQPANSIAPKTKPTVKRIPPTNTATPQSTTSETDDSEKLKLDDTIKAKVTHNPAIKVNVTPATTGHFKFMNEHGAAVKGVEVLLIRKNGTHSGIVTSDEQGIAEVKILNEHVSLLCAIDGFHSYYIADYDPQTPLTITLMGYPSGGSVIFTGRTGYITGLSGRLNPILDSMGATYLYADNIAIDGGKDQPVVFVLHRPIMLEDITGHRVEIEFFAITTDSSLIEYRRP